MSSAVTPVEGWREWLPEEWDHFLSLTGDPGVTVLRLARAWGVHPARIRKAVLDSGLAREEDLPTWGKWGAHRPEEVDKWKRLSRRLIC